jgi:uncharacterized membrane protein
LYCLYLELRLLITPLGFSLFSIVLSVLRITASDYHVIFSLFSIVLSVLRIYNGKERKDKEVIKTVILSTDNTMEKREKTKGLMRIRNSKNRQYNGKERKDKEVIKTVITSLSFLSFPLYCLYLELRLQITTLSFLSFPLYCLYLELRLLRHNEKPQF